MKNSALEFVIVASLFVAACDNGPETIVRTNEALFCENISLETDPASVRIGEVTQLKFVARDERGNAMSNNVICTSNTPSIATVSDDCVVTGVGVGTASIKATCEPNEPGTESIDFAVLVVE